MTLVVQMHYGAWQGGTGECQAARAHVEESRACGASESSCRASPHLCLHLCLPHSWGLAPWIHGIINTDQCSLEDLAGVAVGVFLL